MLKTLPNGQPLCSKYVNLDVYLYIFKTVQGLTFDEDYIYKNLLTRQLSDVA